MVINMDFHLQFHPFNKLNITLLLISLPLFLCQNLTTTNISRFLTYRLFNQCVKFQNQFHLTLNVILTKISYQYKYFYICIKSVNILSPSPATSYEPRVKVYTSAVSKKFTTEIHVPSNHPSKY